MTIFLIDDNSMYLQVTMEKLKPHCDRIFIFSNYKDALNNYSLSPDLIFLDYHFDEEIDGAKILKKFKVANPRQKVIIVSGQENARTVHELVTLGISDYVVKDEGYVDEMIALIREYSEDHTSA